MVPRALEAAERLAQDGISAEVIDIRSLVPLDTRTLLESVGKTGRLFTVEENPRLCGWGAELVSIVCRGGLLEPRRSEHPHHDAARPPARGRRAGGSRDAVGRPHLRDGLQGASSPEAVRDDRVPPPRRVRAHPRGEVAQLHRGRRPARRRQGRRGRPRTPRARRRGRRRHRHDRDARLRRYPPARLDVVVPEPGRRRGSRGRSGVVVGARRLLPARRRLRRDADRAHGRAGGRDHHRGGLVGPAARRRVG